LGYLFFLNKIPRELKGWVNTLQTVVAILFFFKRQIYVI